MERPTAVVTGASSGIGAAFARVLARHGYDLVVVARSVPRLEEIAGRLRAEHAGAVEVLGVDLLRDDGIARVVERLREPARPIELLVNNAGFGTSGAFQELPVDEELDEISLNVVAVAALTHAALGPMVERGHGGVINVSSLGAYQPMPLSATYGATKAFVSSFTNALHEELRGTGVKAMVLAPGFTRTEFHDRAAMGNTHRLPDLVWHSADQVAEIALRAYDRGRAGCIPGAVNLTTAALAKVAPSSLTRRVAGVITRQAY